MAITDTSFDDATDVGGIRYRLHPLDVGFDLRGHGGMAVEVAAEEDPIRISYADAAGERRVINGLQAEVLPRLRRLGYRFRVVGKPPCLRYEVVVETGNYRPGADGPAWHEVAILCGHEHDSLDAAERCLGALRRKPSWRDARIHFHGTGIRSEDWTELGPPPASSP
jgi:hypothetical protein